MIDKVTPPRRPRYTRVLVLFLVILATIQIGSAVRAVMLPPDVAARVSLNPALEIVGGTLWAGLSALAAWRLARGLHHARRWAVLLLTGFAGYTVMRLVAFAQADYDRARIVFLGIMLMVIIFLVVVIPLMIQVWSGEKRQ
jgi:hypothetical protein